MSPRPGPGPADWKRLGEQLTRRRVDLDPRYHNRTVFCAERGIDYRLAYDIEEAKRANFRKTTLAGVAAAYAVTLDSLTGVLDGTAASLAAAPESRRGEPARFPTPPSGVVVPMSLGGDEEEVAKMIMSLPSPSGGLVPWETRREMLRSLLDINDRRRAEGLTG